MSPDEVKAIRRALGLSQVKFAELLGCGWLAVHYWEQGKHKPKGMSVRALHEARRLAGLDSEPPRISLLQRGDVALSR